MRGHCADCDDSKAEARRLRLIVDQLRRDRRERIATACLAGMLANHALATDAPLYADAAQEALEAADALIAELDR